MEKTDCSFSRRGFLAGMLAAGTAGAARGAAMPPVPKGLARGDARPAAPGREGLKVRVTPYFDGGWTMYMFADRCNNVMLSTLFKSPSGKVVMIDGGWPKDADFLVPAIKSLGVVPHPCAHRPLRLACGRPDEAQCGRAQDQEGNPQVPAAQVHRRDGEGKPQIRCVLP